ncbi:hypothetical protein [Streptomyces sp. NPDC094147]|uniref:hypothetical protein n=1 Tax=Streptomyces sp. NPDC094147 TaxID=3366057 RepID=UPI00380C96EF
MAINDTGKRLSSRRVAKRRDRTDQAPGRRARPGRCHLVGHRPGRRGAALVITLLLDHGRQLLYIPGRVVSRASPAMSARWCCWPASRPRP